jgi:hypothetical protein
VSVLSASLLAATPASAWSDPSISITTYGGAEFDYSNKIAVDASGNIYTAGVFNGTVDFDPGAGTFSLTATNEAAFVSKLDSSGNLLWAKKIDGNSDEAINALTIDANGNILLTGYFYGTVDFNPGVGTSNLTSTGNFDVFVVKLNADGEFIWGKNFGGSDDDYSYAITSDANGNVYTTGEFYNSADFDPSASTVSLTAVDWGDVFVSKLDSLGNFIWARKLGGSGFDQGKSISVDSNGDVITAGYFYGSADFDPGAGQAVLTSNGSGDAFISKLDSAGNYIWVLNIGGSSGDEGKSVLTDGNGNIYTVGIFSGTVDFDPGRSEANLTALGPRDIFISKINSSGGFLWAKQLGGTSYEDANAVAVDNSGNVYTTGYFRQTAEFDPGPGFAYMSSNGSSIDAFISKLDSSGNFLWAKKIGGHGDDAGTSIALDSSGNVFTTGYFDGAAEFDSGVSVASLISAGYDDIFILRLNPSGIAESSAASTSGSSPSSSSSSSSSSDRAAAAAAAEAQRQAEIREARAELVRKAIIKEELSLQVFAKADIPGLTSENIGSAQAEIFALPDTARSEISHIIKVVRKFEVVEMIASDRVNRIYSNLYIEIGLISAESKNKVELVSAVRRMNPEDRSTYGTIKSAIEAEMNQIQMRKNHLAAIIARISGGSGK